MRNPSFIERPANLAPEILKQLCRSGESIWLPAIARRSVPVIERTLTASEAALAHGMCVVEPHPRRATLLGPQHQRVADPMRPLRRPCVRRAANAAKTPWAISNTAPSNANSASSPSSPIP
jgi:hypothetical protein